MRDLPQELVNYIIDFLHDCKEALRSCTLTCRSWLSASRTHLFRTILLETAAQFSAFSRVLDRCPELADYVSHVRIGDLINPPYNPNDMDEWSDLPSLPSEDALRLLSRLQNVRTLQPWCVKLIHATAFNIFLQCIDGLKSTLTSLIIHNMLFTNCDKLITFVAFFPCLESLTLSPRLLGSAPPKLLTAPPRLNKIVITSFLQIQLLYDWFRSFASQIRHAEISVGRRHANPTLRVLEIFGEHVVNFRISSYGWYKYETFISALTSLQRLTVETNLIGFTQSDSNSNDWSPEWMSLAVADVSSSRITSITCKILLSTSCINALEDAFGEVDWLKFEYVLLSPRFSRLESIRFEVELDEENWKDIALSSEVFGIEIPVSRVLKSSLPRLEERGIIRVAIPSMGELLPYYRFS